LKKINPNSSSKDSSFGGEQYLYLTSRGRTSGQPREIEIWFAHLDGRFFLIAEYQTSHWVQNLHVNPEVRVRIAGTSFAARARFVSSETETRLHRAVADLFRTKYGWGDGSVVELFPESHEE
jgi:deazaflavin-dependent oxidoreductase (nitroreductase family)